jgi:transposase
MNEVVTPVVGIDVSKSKLDIALLVKGKLKSKSLPNSRDGYAELGKWLRNQGVALDAVHVCMESTGVYSEPLALALVDMGMKVSVANPASVKGFAQGLIIRNKNDKADAAVIARYCAMMSPALWQPPPREQRQLRALSEHLASLKEVRQQQANRMEAFKFADQTEAAAEAKTHLDWLDKEIKRLQKNIDDYIDRHPDIRRDAELIESIPGLARVTAGKVLARVGDLRRFGSAKELAAYIGVTPRQRQSGSSVKGRTTISRIGCRELRAALYMPAVSAMTRNPILREFATRLKATGMPTMAVITAVMRKLVHQMYGVVRSGKPFDPNYLDKKLAIQDGI